MWMWLSSGVHVSPVYLCIRNRDVVCGVLDQQTVDGLLQVGPVVFPVVFYSHCIENCAKQRGDVQVFLY